MQIEDGLEKLLLGKYDESLKIFADCSSLPQAEKLSQIALMLKELSTYADELSKFNLSVKMPDLSNSPAESLKNLHSKLKRLARQLLMATTNYPVSSMDYMGDLSVGLNSLISQVVLSETEAEHSRSRDTDTGLLTRRAFMRKVYDIIEVQPFSIGIMFCCQLDNIKYINETYGYASGDLYINKLVEVLSSREEELCIPARASGNEFALYAHGFETEEDAYGFAQDISKALFNAQVALPHEEIKIRASYGVALYPHDARTSDILLSYACHAMVEAYSSSRGEIMRFNPEMYRSKARRIAKQESLDELIEKKLIHFAFQPIVCLREATVTAYEALMRPKTDTFSGPLDILSAAEGQSKLSQLEKLTFEEIFEWIFNNAKLLGDRKIFFNTISMQYLDVEELRNIHQHYATISKSIVFEILETEAIESVLLQKVNNLRKDLSALIAIDDFGCGHSNALRLISISPDILKIDRFFIHSIHNAPETKKGLLSSILAYCKANRILTLAEGVETHEELACVIDMGFDFAQGYYFSRPKFGLVDLDPRFQRELAAFLLQKR